MPEQVVSLLIATSVASDYLIKWRIEKGVPHMTPEQDVVFGGPVIDRIDNIVADFRRIMYQRSVDYAKEENSKRVEWRHLRKSIEESIVALNKYKDSLGKA